MMAVLIHLANTTMLSTWEHAEPCSIMTADMICSNKLVLGMTSQAVSPACFPTPPTSLSPAPPPNPPTHLPTLPLLLIHSAILHASSREHCCRGSCLQPCLQPCQAATQSPPPCPFASLAVFCTMATPHCCVAYSSAKVDDIVYGATQHEQAGSGGTDPLWMPWGRPPADSHPLGGPGQARAAASV